MKIYTKLTLIIVFILLTIPAINAEEIEINDSGKITYDWTGEDTHAAVSPNYAVAEYRWNWTLLWNFDGYPVPQSLTMYYSNLYLCNETDCVPPDTSTCLSGGYGFANDIPATTCVYPLEDSSGTIVEYKVYFDFNAPSDLNFTGLQSGQGYFDGIKYFQIDYSLQYDTGMAHANLKADDGAGDWQFGNLQQSSGASWVYSVPTVIDYWNYEYYYNNSTTTEYFWLNVSKTGSTSKWSDLYYRSLLDNEENLFDYTIESSFDQTGFNWTTNGYLMNISLNYTANEGETLTFPQPYQQPEQPTEPDKVYLQFYFKDSNANLLPYNEKQCLDIESTDSSYNKTDCNYTPIKTFTVPEGEHYEYTANATNYTAFANHPSGIDVGNQNFYINEYFYENNTAQLEDSENDTLLTFKIYSKETGSPLENAHVSIMKGAIVKDNYTDSNGQIQFIVSKNSTWTYSIEKNSYYSILKNVDILEKPVEKTEYLTKITTETKETPPPEEEPTDVDETQVYANFNYDKKYMKIQDEYKYNNPITAELDIRLSNYEKINETHVKYIDSGDISLNPTDFSWYLGLFKDDELIKSRAFYPTQEFDLYNLESYAKYNDKAHINPPVNNWTAGYRYVIVYADSPIDGTSYTAIKDSTTILNESGEGWRSNITPTPPLDEQVAGGEGGLKPSESRETLIDRVINVFATPAMIALIFSAVFATMGGKKAGSGEVGVLAFAGSIMIFAMQGFLPIAIMFIFAIMSLLVLAHMISSKITGSGGS